VINQRSSNINNWDRLIHRKATWKLILKTNTNICIQNLV